MCGICGIIRFDNKPVQKKPIREMMRIMKHRGPDDEGVFIENTIGLGFVRLSIIDLSTAGHQPMTSSDNRYVIVFNGEIYNYIELRDELKILGVDFKTQTDTEVLLNAYLNWGEDCLPKFNGMWAFVIYDRLEEKIFAARDRFGVKPFYFIKKAGYFAFCSEIKPLLSLLGHKPSPNPQSIFDFLVFNRTDQSEETFFKEVNKLQHGEKFSFSTKPEQDFNSTISSIRWYDLKNEVSKITGFKDSNEFKEMFFSSINLRLRSDVPVGVCLSGGLDSSSIVSVLLKTFERQDLNTFSAIYNKGQSGDEMEFIQEYKPYLKNMYYTAATAETLKYDLIRFINAHAEPMPGTSPYAQFKVMELAKGKVVVTLDGQGADEQLAGYHYFYGFFFKDLFKNGRLIKLFSEIKKYLLIHRSFYGIKSFIYLMFSQKLRTSLRLLSIGYLTKDFKREHKSTSSISRDLYGSNSLKSALFDHFEFKLEHLLKWEDINSMYFSLEARVPFLDHRLVEKVMATNIDLIIEGGVTKQLLRESMIGILPEKIRMRQDKIGFETPQDEWFRTCEWQTIIEEVLLSKSFKKRNIIDPEIAFRKYKKHLSGTISCAEDIWKWVHLELWYREFID